MNARARSFRQHPLSPDTEIEAAWSEEAERKQNDALPNWRMVQSSELLCK
jgi:hypothetical protein